MLFLCAMCTLMELTAGGCCMCIRLQAEGLKPNTEYLNLKYALLPCLKSLLWRACSTLFTFVWKTSNDSPNISIFQLGSSFAYCRKMPIYCHLYCVMARRPSGCLVNIMVLICSRWPWNKQWPDMSICKYMLHIIEHYWSARLCW